MGKRKLLLVSILFALAVLFALPVQAGTFKTVSWTKTKYGSYYVWRRYNAEIWIQKVGSSTIKTIRRPVYTLCGVTDGSVLYYTACAEKRDNKVTLYKYYLKSGKHQKVALIKNAYHICGSRGGYVYGNAPSNGSANECVYRFNLKTKKKKIILKNFMIERASGRYLYGTRNWVKYRYDLVTKKLIRNEWKYVY